MLSIEELKTIYPDLEINQLPHSADDAIELMLDNQWLSIPRTDLSESEQALLSRLGQPVESEQRAWYSFLWGLSTKLPTENECDSRVIQFQVTFTDNAVSKADWLAALQAYFNQVYDAFWTDGTTGVLIEVKQNDAVETNFAGILQSLDAMFYTTTTFYVGHFWPVDQTLPGLFKMEQQLFSQSQKAAVNTFSPSLFQYLIQHDQGVAQLIKALRASLPADSETNQMVNLFFKNHGKLSQTAKQLFIHRNTLVYRIDKFYRLTGFDLRNNYDLTLCHLLMS